jgi:3-dehydroquinate dehydratase-2
VEKILLLQGANMSFLGRRQPEIYGTTTAAELDAMLLGHAQAHAYRLEIFYTHVEGEAIGRLYRAADEGVQGLIMNPAGFNYAGYALRDCVLALPFPYVEVHMSNVAKRGIHSVLAEAAAGVVFGFGTYSYVLALDAMLHLLRTPRPDASRAA